MYRNMKPVCTKHGKDMEETGESTDGLTKWYQCQVIVRGKKCKEIVSVSSNFKTPERLNRNYDHI